MREIKFRIWDKRYEMMYQDSSHFYLTADGEVIDVNTDLKIPNEQYNLMQFTGLYDKNNTPIYEGDIVKKGDKIGRIFYHWSDFKIEGINEYQYLSLYPYYEVIGNTHDNPELSKEIDNRIKEWLQNMLKNL